VPKYTLLTCAPTMFKATGNRPLLSTSRMAFSVPIAKTAVGIISAIITTINKKPNSLFVMLFIIGSNLRFFACV